MSKPPHWPHECPYCNQPYWFPTYKVVTKPIYTQSEEDKRKTTGKQMWATKVVYVADSMIPVCPSCGEAIVHTSGETTNE